MITMHYTMAHRHLRADLWEGREGVPIMIVASNYLTPKGRLRTRITPPQCRPLACDCGGYYFAAKGYDFPFSHEEYVAWLDVMQPDWAATMDYPCEPDVAPNDKEVLRRQEKCVFHALTLMRYERSWAWLPIIQGRTVEQYISHARLYKSAHAVRPYMGIGSLCRRTSLTDISAIVTALTAELPGTRFHLFGVKTGIFKRRDALPESVRSADSGAWNSMFFDGRKKWWDARDRGLTQSQYEVWEALPAYRATVDAALSRPQQQTLGLVA